MTHVQSWPANLWSLPGLLLTACVPIGCSVLPPTSQEQFGRWIGHCKLPSYPPSVGGENKLQGIPVELCETTWTWWAEWLASTSQENVKASHSWQKLSLQQNSKKPAGARLQMQSFSIKFTIGTILKCKVINLKANYSLDKEASWVTGDRAGAISDVPQATVLTTMVHSA